MDSNEISKRMNAHLEQADFVLLAQRGDQLDVLLLIARLGEDAQVRLAAVEGLDALLQAAGEAVVDERLLQDLLDGVLEGHGLLLLLLLGDLLDDLLGGNLLTGTGTRENMEGHEMRCAVRHGAISRRDDTAKAAVTVAYTSSSDMLENLLPHR